MSERNPWKAKQDAARAEKNRLGQQARANAVVAQKINTTGWRFSGNALLIKLKVSDLTVSYYLNKMGQRALASTQSSDLYDFEFHPMHTTGNPVYIRMADNDENSNVPKFDTKNKTAPEFVNAGKITLTNTQFDQLRQLIGDNWNFLSYVADQVYNVDRLI